MGRKILNLEQKLSETKHITDLLELFDRSTPLHKKEEVEGNRLNDDQKSTSSLFESIAQIDEGAHQSATSHLNNIKEPTENQKIAGNYKKGHVVFSDLKISIENPKGSVRKGVDETGKSWEVKINNHYGDINGTTGADGDPVDVFLGENEEAEYVYIVHQVDPDTKKYDEDKVMLGFNDEEDAKSAYLSNYEDGWKGLGNITTLSISGFKDKLKITKNGEQVSFLESVESKSFTPLDRFLALISHH